MGVEQIIKALTLLADAEIAQHSTRFFKTGANEYGAGDKFLGIRVTKLRQLLRSCRETSLDDALILLKSEYHELRLFALLLMVAMFERAKRDDQQQKLIIDAYLGHTQYINNWDLVDSSAHKILGKYLLDKPRDVLHQLACSADLWEKRIAMMATYTLIKHGEFTDTLLIANTLLNDQHDLIHKIVGWMLREVGNQDRAVAQAFLNQHYHNMPRTMLRYAIEKYPKTLRADYLSGRI